MPFRFQAVDIIVFDIHTVVRPIIEPSLLKPTFAFLTDKDKYNEQFRLQKIIDPTDYIVRPIRKRDLEWDHFWNHYIYQDNFGGDEPDFYSLQIPFIFKPKNLDLSISNGSIKVEINPAVFLFTMGWSSNLRISLTGDISSYDLQKFIGDLKYGQPFSVSGGGQHSLSSVFIELKNTITNEIYASQRKLGDKPYIYNHFFISLQKTSSQPKFFDSVQSKFSREQRFVMAADEKAELFGILYGKEIDINEMGKYEQGTLYTWFNDANFALTQFDIGSLVFMQEIASMPNPKLKRLKCFASNLRYCTLLTFMFLGFQSRFKKLESPVANDSLNYLVNRVNYLLELIKGAYNNAYCQRLYQNHGSLKNLG